MLGGARTGRGSLRTEARCTAGLAGFFAGFLTGAERPFPAPRPPGLRLSASFELG